MRLLKLYLFLEKTLSFRQSLITTNVASLIPSTWKMSYSMRAQIILTFDDTSTGYRLPRLIGMQSYLDARFTKLCKGFRNFDDVRYAQSGEFYIHMLTSGSIFRYKSLRMFRVQYVSNTYRRPRACALWCRRKQMLINWPFFPMHIRAPCVLTTLCRSEVSVAPRQSHIAPCTTTVRFLLLEVVTCALYALVSIQSWCPVFYPPTRETGFLSGSPTPSSSTS